MNAGAPVPEPLVSARAAVVMLRTEVLNSVRILAAGLATMAAAAASYCEAVTADYAAAVADRVQAAPARDGDRA